MNLNTSYNSALSKFSLGLDHDLKKQRNSVIDCDASAKKYFWTVAIGRPTIASKRMATQARQLGDIRKRQVKQVVNSGVSAPQRDSIFRIPLSADLQTYFVQMEKAVSHTCHPYQIHQEALQVVSNLLCGQPSRYAQQIAKTIFFAGTARIEYTRTVALLVHDVMTELVWRDCDTKKRLGDTLLGLVVGAFNNSWTRNDLYVLSTKSGVGPILPTLEETRTQMLNTAAFMGDLFAISLVPVTVMQTSIRLLVDNLSTVMHCRALYLIFMHTSSHISTPLGNPFLSECRATIVRKGKAEWDDMMRRWFIEICNVIDKMLTKEAELPSGATPSYAPLAWQRWDSSLCCDSLLGMLGGGGAPRSVEEMLFTSVMA